MTMLAALVGAVALMHDGATRVLRGGTNLGGGSGGGSGGGGKKGGAGPLLAILLVVWIVSWILAPIITQILALAVSRKREYLADAMSAQFTRNPMAKRIAILRGMGYAQLKKEGGSVA